MEKQALKRESVDDGGPPEKRLRGEPEDPSIYSEKIRERLQNSSRTGQACDRCKQRKMKCDPSLDGCQPCRKANLPCKATDRITGDAHLRGEAARLNRENEDLRKEIQVYRRQLGLQDNAQMPTPPFSDNFATPNGSNGHNVRPERTQSDMHSDSQPEIGQRSSADIDQTMTGNACRSTSDTPGRGYDTGPHQGPIHGTKIDLTDGYIDIAGFKCPDIDDAMKLSQEILPVGVPGRRPSTAKQGSQRPERPQMPNREEAMQYAENYLKVIGTYVPIVHGPTFRKLVTDFYDDPDAFDDRPAETVMITVVFAMFTFQMATRNPSMRKEKLAESNRLYKYALSFYSQLLWGESLECMQALALFLVYARSFPKPGNSWSLSNMVLTRVIDLDYHRSSKKIMLPPSQQNPLAIELRKRIFWSILGIQVNISVKLGRPMSISPQDIDVELPLAILDSEITPQGLQNRSGKCDFWGAIFVSKLLPISMDLYKNVILVRKPEAEYLEDLAGLDARISQWRQEWDEFTVNETRTGSHKIATHMIDIWAAELRIVLHHVSLCTSRTPEVFNKNMAACLLASRTILRNTAALMKEFKGPDFTWHSVSGYVLGLSIALQYHSNRKESLNVDAFKQMKHELGEWLIVMKSSDRYMSCGDYLHKVFHPRVQRCLEDAQNLVIASDTSRNRDGSAPQQAPNSNRGGRGGECSMVPNLVQSPRSSEKISGKSTALQPPQRQQQQQPHKKQQTQSYPDYSEQPPRASTAPRSIPTSHTPSGVVGTLQSPQTSLPPTPMQTNHPHYDDSYPISNPQAAFPFTTASSASISTGSSISAAPLATNTARSDSYPSYGQPQPQSQFQSHTSHHHHQQQQQHRRPTPLQPHSMYQAPLHQASTPMQHMPLPSPQSQPPPAAPQPQTQEQQQQQQQNLPPAPSPSHSQQLSTSASSTTRQDPHLAMIDAHSTFTLGIWPFNIVQYPHYGELYEG